MIPRPLARYGKRLAASPHRLAAQDVALSRRKHRFDSGWGRQGPVDSHHFTFDWPATSAMRKSLLFLLAALASVGSCGIAQAAETCTSYLTAQREKMFEAALACQGSLDDAHGVRSQVEAERSGQKLFTYPECSKPVSAVGQKDLFQECVRTHLCAAQTYACAIRRTTEPSSVQQCGQATIVCKLSDPIPQ